MTNAIKMMQFTILRENLLKSLQKVAGVIEARQTIPILSHVLLELSPEELTLTGTDNEITITSETHVEQLIHPGKGTVSAHTLLEVCRRLPENSLISCQQETNQFLIKSGNSHFRLMSLSPQDFPSVSFEGEKYTLSMPENKLLDTIKTTRFAMAHQDVRYYLNGMLWDIQTAKFQVVATDGHRLASKFIEMPSEQAVSVIVPRKTIIEISRLLGESDHQVNLYLTENQVCIKGKDYYITSRLVGGTFPDYTQLIPKSNSERTAIINRDDFREALSRQSILLKGKKYKGIQLKFTENSLELLVSNFSQESSQEQLDIEYHTADKEEFFIAFNIDYLEEVLEVLPVGKIKMTLPLQEGVTLLEALEGKNHIYMIMPMRL